MKHAATSCREVRSRYATVAAIACLAVAGCGSGQPPATPDDEAAPAAATSATPPTPDAAADEWPEGVLRAYHWTCDGGLELAMKNLVRDDAITLALHEGERRLEHVPSASGAKYADHSIEFWIKGGTAVYTHKPAAPVNCTEARAQSLLADAKARGVVYRGQGNEPGWIVEIGPAGQLYLESDYGSKKQRYSGVESSGDEAGGGRIYTARQGDDSVEVTIRRETCTDDMSGMAFDHSVLVEAGGTTLRGCGRRIGPG